MKGKELKKAVEEVMGSQWPALGSAGGKGFGKGSGKSATKLERRERTIRFSNFPTDTKEKDIIDGIKGVLEQVQGDVEEVYAYGKYADAGAARFVSAEAMW
eukprot:12425974-Karenia_brevis.AAC.1